MLIDRTMTFVQITNQTNPFVRYTRYYDPDLGIWTEWQQINSNQLY